MRKTYVAYTLTFTAKKRLMTCVCKVATNATCESHSQYSYYCHNLFALGLLAVHIDSQLNNARGGIVRSLFRDFIGTEPARRQAVCLNRTSITVGRPFG